MPLGEYMQSVLKSNKSILRHKKKKFDNQTFVSKGTLDFSHLPKSNADALGNIKKNIIKESFKKTRLRFVVCICIMIVLVVFILIKMN